MIGYPPEVAELLARGAEVSWCPLELNGEIVGALIIGVAWPLYWDAPCFRDATTGRAMVTTTCVLQRRDDRPVVMPRPGPVTSPIAAQAP